MEQPDTCHQQQSKAPFFVMLVVRAFAFSVEVFLHRNFGERAVGMPAAAALLIIPSWVVCWPEENPAPLLGFWWVYVAMCVVAKTSSTFRRRGGAVEHSMYTGWPRLKFVLPWCSEVTFKRYVEPLLVFTFGILTMSLNVVLGSYLFAAGLALACSVGMIEAAEHARAQQMHDAFISQRHAADRFRRMGGDQF